MMSASEKRKPWRCNVCLVALFDDNDVALAHEGTCDARTTGSECDVASGVAMSTGASEAEPSEADADLSTPPRHENDDIPICPLCCDEGLTSTVAVVLSACQHRSCGACLVRWMEREESSGRDAGPTCPFCRVAIREEDVARILGRPFHPCTGAAIREATDDDEIDEFTLHWINQNTVPCALCGFRIEKENGCDLMECLCGYRFCYKCGAAGGVCNCNPGHMFLSDRQIQYSHMGGTSPESSDDNVSRAAAAAAVAVGGGGGGRTMAIAAANFDDNGNVVDGDQDGGTLGDDRDDEDMAEDDDDDESDYSYAYEDEDEDDHFSGFLIPTYPFETTTMTGFPPAVFAEDFAAAAVGPSPETSIANSSRTVTRAAFATAAAAVGPFPKTSIANSSRTVTRAAFAAAAVGPFPETSIANSSRTVVAETVQHFITTRDAVTLEVRAVDELQPLLSDLMNALVHLPDTPDVFSPNDKMRRWLERLNAMRAVDMIDEDDLRQLSHDLNSAYSEFSRYRSSRYLRGRT